jgi:hypothetical protein
MIEASLNHYQILEESLSGRRAVDEQTFASLAILRDRLERLKKIDKVFANVEFSWAVERLKRHNRPLAVG